MRNVILLFLISLFIGCKISNKGDNNMLFSSINAKVLESATLSSGSLIRVDSFPSKFIKPRSVDVWLPENYTKTKKYAVLYMHDGQMLFDANTTWNKQEWKIDEVASDLIKNNTTKDFIVVAIHNIPSIRWLDLFPEKAMNYLTKEEFNELKSISNSSIDLKDLTGDEYLKFIIKELKPYIDYTYSVHTNKENTFVAGSSMGGLMSMYAVAEYPNVFAGAACISSHWEGARPIENNPLPKAIFSYLKENLPDSKSHKMYFDYGNKTLDMFYPKYAPQVDIIFLNNGYTTENYKNLFFEGTDHSELSWQKRIDIPLTFLLKK